jgi:hypothetical protein
MEIKTILYIFERRAPERRERTKYIRDRREVIKSQHLKGECMEK